MYAAQSLRIHSSFHNTPSFMMIYQGRHALEEIDMFYFKILSTYSTSNNTFSTSLFIIFKKNKRI